MTEPKQLNDEQTQKIRSMLGVARNLADALEGGGGSTAAVTRLGARAANLAVRSLTPPLDEPVKVAKVGSTFASVLAANVEKKLGPEWLGFEPETLQEFTNLTPTELEGVLMAKLVLHTHQPFEDWHYFEKAVIAFNGRELNFEVTQDISVAEAALGVMEMRRLDAVTAFSPEVGAFMAKILFEEGFVKAPAVLQAGDIPLLGLLSDHGRAVREQLLQGATNETVRLQRAMVDAVDKLVAEQRDQLDSELA